MSTLRASETTHQSLKELARLTGMPMQTVLDQAVSSYRKIVFLEKLNEDFARFRENPDQWSEEQAEREIWEMSLADGLDVDAKGQS